ncbi:hypothetical protein BKA80DRAFT_343303 [Phyllosticta citrichinensis]
MRRVVLDKDVTIPYSTKQPPPSIRKLRLSLRQGLHEPADDRIRKNLWKWYARVKVQHPDALRLVPDDAWNVLWATQSHVSPTNDNRMAHMKELANDMQRTGSSRLRMAYLDALSESGEETEAALEWIDWYNSSSDPERPDFLEQGIKLVVRIGMVEYAQHILLGLEDIDPKAVLRASKYIFAPLFQDGMPDAVKEAWELYVDVQGKYGDQMSNLDYEFYWMGFLRAGARNHAVKVFEHMVRSRKFETTFQKDKTEFHHQFTRIAKSATSVGDVHRLFLPMLNTLLSFFNARLFFKTWQQRLLDFNDTRAALVVVELAYEKGYVPTPRIMDQILSNWVSSPTATTRELELAEEVALRMVSQRLETVQRRKITHNSEISKRRRKPSIWKERPVPPASSATFGVLFDLCLKRNRKTLSSDKASAEFGNILGELQKCQLPFDSRGLSIVLQFYLQNHDLYMVSQTIMEHLKHAPFQNVPQEPALVMIWNACYLSQRRRGTKFLRGTKQANNLSAAKCMQYTLQSLRKRWRGRARTMEAMSTRNQVLHMMMKCFCSERDYGGALMALRVFAGRFGIYPTPKMIEIIAGSVASLAFRTRSPLQRRQMAGSPLFQADATKLIQIMNKMFNMRVQNDIMMGDSVNTTRRAQLLLETLTKFLRITMLREQSPDQVEDRIDRLRKQWGVEDCSTGDETASEVYLELYIGNALEDDGEFRPETTPEEKEFSLEEGDAVSQGQDNVPEEEHTPADESHLEARLEEAHLQQKVQPGDKRLLAGEHEQELFWEEEQLEEDIQERGRAAENPPRENKQVEQDFMPENERWLTDDPWLKPRREDRNIA